MTPRCAGFRATALFILCGAFFFGLLLWAKPASAYAWMISHQYTGCVPCHADPSGGGLLTEYGRAQGEILLRTRYGVPPPDDGGKAARFLWSVPLPEWLLATGSFRNLVLVNHGPDPRAPGQSTTNVRFVQMQADLKAQILAGRFRASGSLGFVHQGALPAAITHGVENNLVSREHWLGLALGEDNQFLLRVGRMNLPYGIRSIEHTLWVRTSTRTDINAAQQHGIAFAYSGEKLRGEIMGILGNYQLNPDAFRERGYSGYLELALAERAAIGVSSLLTYAGRNIYNPTIEASIRQAHGLFGRISPVEKLVLFAEADALVPIQDGKASFGVAGLLQADYEITQGLHLVGTGEILHDGSLPKAGPSFGGWASVVWFFAPHADLRIDFFDRAIWNGESRDNYFAITPQLHLYL